MHKLSSWRDHIRIKFEASVIFSCLIEDDLVFPVGFDFGLAQLLFLCILSCSESTGSLLVLFCSRSHSIDRQIDHLLWLNNFDDFVSIFVDVIEDLLLALWLGTILRMSTRMDDTIHVKIEVVHCWIVILDLLLLYLLLLTLAI